jgi:hypothetical protein
LRILLDECVPRRLGRDLVGHDVSHVTSQGWGGKRNGVLLEVMRMEGFEVLITVDRNLAFQQGLPRIPVAVMVLHAHSNRIADLRPLVPAILDALASVSPGQITRVGV